MPAATSWRVVGCVLSPAAAAMELSALHLYESAGDEAFSQTSTLLHFDGTDGSTVFNDVLGHAYSRVGAGVISTAHSVYGGSSAYFDGGGYISTPNSVDFDLGGGDFTLECFIRRSGGGAALQHIMGKWHTSGTSSYSMWVRSDGKLGFAHSVNGNWDAARYAESAVWGVPAGQFVHVAVVRAGGLITLYVSGAAVASYGAGTDVISNTPNDFTVGGNPASQHLLGWVDDLRVTRAARYLGNFVPPTAAHPDSAAGMPTRACAAALLTCSIPPSDGGLSALQDEDGGTVCSWSADRAGAPGFGVRWDFAADKSIVGLRLGGASAAAWPQSLTLQYLAGDAWVTSGVYGRYPYPGSGVLTDVGAQNLALVTETARHRAVIAATADVHGFVTAPASRLLTARDVAFGGAGVISGTVKRDADPLDLPMRRRVRLFDERSGLLVREAWSEAATGAYSFAGLDATRTYAVVAYDHEHHYRAVIADNMTPEAAP